MSNLKWIPVEKFIPDDGVRVLICFEAGKYSGSGRRRIFIGYRLDGMWCPSPAREFPITHWMPLPSLPRV